MVMVKNEMDKIDINEGKIMMIQIGLRYAT